MTGAAALAEADARALRRRVDLDIPEANFWNAKRPAIPALDRSTYKPASERNHGGTKRNQLPDHDRYELRCLPTTRNRSELGVGN